VPLGLLLFAGAIAALYARTRQTVSSSPVIHDDHAVPPQQAGPR